MKKMLRRRERDVALLKRRLDCYNDNWRALPVVLPNPKRKIQRKRGPKPKVKKEVETKISKPITEPSSLNVLAMTATATATDTVLSAPTITSTAINISDTLLSEPTITSTPILTTPKKARKPRAKRIDSEKDELNATSSLQCTPKSFSSPKGPSEIEPVGYYDIKDIRLTADQIHQMKLLQSPKTTVHSSY